MQFLNKVFVVGVLAIFATPFAAQTEICEKVTVAACPTLFLEECRDPSFRNANVDACFDAISGAQDADFCSSPEVEACRPNTECEALANPIDAYFCRAGQSQCTKNIPDLLSEYNRVLDALNVSLGAYSGLTELDLNKATSIELLCGFPIDELESLRDQSASEISTIEGSEQSIETIDMCAQTMQGFIDQGAPVGFPADTWDLIARELISGMDKVELTQGEIQGKIQNLKEAPQTLSSLAIAYGVICPS